MACIPLSAETSSDWARAISSTDTSANTLDLVPTLVEVWSRRSSNKIATGRTAPFLQSSKAEYNIYHRRKLLDFPMPKIENSGKFRDFIINPDTKITQ